MPLRLYDMPDELIVLMVDNSMRIAQQLACTNIILRMRLRETSAFITVLRFCCINSSDALRFERYSQLHIGELVLTVGVCADSLGDLAHCNDTPSPSLPAHGQPGFCTNCGGDV